MDQLSDNATVDELACLDIYVECMDSQLSDTMAGYEYLLDDEGMEVLADIGEPIRCLYYDPESGSLSKNSGDLAKDDRTVQVSAIKEALGAAASMYRQRDLNNLYYSYNFGCDIDRNYVNNIGRKVNMCKLNTSADFATKHSISYYAEVLKRLVSGGLKMINVQSSTIFNNFIASLPVEDVGDYYIDPAVVNDIYAGLGLESETELFSVKVAPPLSAGLYVSSDHFRQATDLCFAEEALEKPSKETAAARKKREETNSRIKEMSKYGCFGLRSSMERYYLTGKWHAASFDEYGEAVGAGEDIDTAFFSAKESCRMYEQALITVRDEKYGLFDTQMQNYIEENLDKVISNIINSSSAIAEATGPLKAADTKSSTDMTNLLADKGYSILDMSFQKWKADNDLLALDRSVKDSERKSVLALTKTYLDANRASAVAACIKMIESAYTEECGADGSRCFVCQISGGKNDFTSINNVKFGTALQAATKRHIKIKGIVEGNTGVAPGTVISSDAPGTDGVYQPVASTVEGGGAWDDYQVDPKKADGTRDTAKKHGWYVVPCTKVLDMNNQFLKDIKTTVGALCGTSLQSTVSSSMSQVFTGWTEQ